MARRKTLCSWLKVSGTGSQDISLAVDSGGAHFCGARLRVEKIEGGATSGSATFALQDAMDNIDVDFLTNSDLTWSSVPYDASTPKPFLATSEKFLQFLRWTCTSWTFAGGANYAVYITIELLWKD